MDKNSFEFNFLLAFKNNSFFTKIYDLPIQFSCKYSRIKAGPKLSYGYLCESPLRNLKTSYQKETNGDLKTLVH